MTNSTEQSADVISSLKRNLLRIARFSYEIGRNVTNNTIQRSRHSNHLALVRLSKGSRIMAEQKPELQKKK